MSEQMTWIKSSYSGTQANCVEVAVCDAVAVRDTKDRQGPELTFSPKEWRRFAEELKRSLSSDL